MRNAQHHLDRRHKGLRLQVTAVGNREGKDEDATAHRRPDRVHAAAQLGPRLVTGAPPRDRDRQQDGEDHRDRPGQQRPTRLRQKTAPRHCHQVCNTPQQEVPSPILGGLAPLPHHRFDQRNPFRQLSLVHRASACYVSVSIHSVTPSLAFTPLPPTSRPAGPTALRSEWTIP